MVRSARSGSVHPQPAQLIKYVIIHVWQMYNKGHILFIKLMSGHVRAVKRLRGRGRFGQEIMKTC